MTKMYFQAITQYYIDSETGKTTVTKHWSKPIFDTNKTKETKKLESQQTIDMETMDEVLL
jgi:hypothetical protein